jgi:hypothetical protein
VALDPNISVVAMVPVAGYPVGMGVGWGFVGAGNPDVAVAVPAVIACMPGPVGVLVGRRRDALMNRGRGTNANYNLGLGDTCSEDEPTDGREYEILHWGLSPYVYNY